MRTYDEALHSDCLAAPRCEEPNEKTQARTPVPPAAIVSQLPCHGTIPPEPADNASGIDDNLNAAFLDTVFATVPESYTLSLWCKGGNEKFTVWSPNTVEGRKSLYGQALLYSLQGYDVYFSVAYSVTAGSEYDRMTNDRAAGIPGVWADIDVGKPGTPASIEEALDFLRSLPLPPSLVTRSGSGLHVLWLFEHAWIFANDEDKRRAEALIKGNIAFLNAVKGYTFDPVGDLARVLRVPGTKNYKPDYRTGGGEAPPVYVMHRDTVRYSIEDMEQYALPMTVTRATESTEHSKPGEWLQSQPHTCTLSPSQVLQQARDFFGDKFIRLFDDGDLSRFDEDNSRADMSLCHMLAAACGEDPHVVDALFRRSALMREKWDKCHNADGKSYGELTISKVVRAVVQTSDGGTASGEEGKVKPVIVINGSDPNETINHTLAILRAGNEKEPYLYERNGEKIRLNFDEKSEPFIEKLTPDGLLSELLELMVFVKQGRNGQTPTLPDSRLVKAFLARRKLGLPGFAGLTNSPIMRDDGSLVLKPGYDLESKRYYYARNGECVPVVPDNPTQDDAIKAARYLRENPYHGFPFAGDTAWANTLAFALAIIMRPVLGRVPLFVFDATKARTGKGLLVRATSIITTGESHASVLYSESEEEMRKALTTYLLGPKVVLCFDNITQDLKSTALTKLLTDDEWTDRLLGLNQAVTLLNNKILCATVNNARIKKDMPFRSVICPLDAECSEPWKRTFTKCHPLEPYCRHERAELLGKLLTMVRAYAHAGYPPATVPVLGGFETFTEKVGGVLAFSGVEGFLGNLDEAIQEEEQAWEYFLITLAANTQLKPFLASNLTDGLAFDSDIRGWYALYQPVDGFPDEVADAFLGTTPGQIARRLGNAFTRHKGERYGKLGIRLEKTAKQLNGCHHWIVQADDMGALVALLKEQYGEEWGFV